MENCKIERSSSKGRYLVTTVDVSAGELVVSEPQSPLLVAPTTLSPHPACFGCNYPLARAGVRCSDCLMPLCEESCQTGAAHSAVCPDLSRVVDHGFAASQELFRDFDLVAPIKAATLAKKRPELFRELESNREAKERTPDWARVQETATRMLKYFKNGSLSQREAEDLICVLDCNTFQVLCCRTAESLCALYDKPSSINHSCRPNARPVFDRANAMRIVAVEDISAGSEVTLSYLTPFMTTTRRREALARGKCFKCNCERCCDPTELGSFSSALTCAACKTGHLLPPTPNDDEDAAWQCQNCQLFLDSEKALRLDSRLAVEASRLGSVGSAMPPSTLEKYMEAYSPHLHPNHAFLSQVKMWLCEAYGSPTSSPPTEEEWEKKEKYCRELALAMRNIEPPMSLLQGLISLEQCDGLLHLGRVAEAGEALKRAEAVFRHEDPSSPEGAPALRVAELKVKLKKKKKKEEA